MNMDVHTKKQRSYNMSCIKSRFTHPELEIEKLLRDLKIPYKTHLKMLPGKPDFFIPSKKIVIEVYGCFWHGHKNCRFFKIPLTNQNFWIKKIDSNRSRDIKNLKQLKALNIKRHIIWECQIKSGAFFTSFLSLFNP